MDLVFHLGMTFSAARRTIAKIMQTAAKSDIFHIVTIVWQKKIIKLFFSIYKSIFNLCWI